MGGINIPHYWRRQQAGFPDAGCSPRQWSLVHHSCCTGERKSKCIRGCIVGPDVAILSVVIIKQGTFNIHEPMATVVPKRLGPNGVTQIHRFSDLGKNDDACCAKRLCRRRRGVLSHTLRCRRSSYWLLPSICSADATSSHWTNDS